LLLADLNKNPEFAAMMEVPINAKANSMIAHFWQETSILAHVWWKGNQRLLDYACAAHPAILYAVARYGEEHLA
jgi:hypothetical protein